MLGVGYDWNRETDKSLAAHNQSLQIRRQLYGKDHFDVARGYAAIGDLYWYRDQFQQAVKFSGNAIDIINKLECGNTLRAGRTYYSLATAYRGLADFERANIYGSKALSILADKSYGDKARCNLLLGNINLQMARFQ